MKQKIFIDANFICSLYNPEDSLYKKANDIKRLIKEFDPALSNFILLEIYTILSQRISKKFAIEFGKRIRQRHQYVLFWVDRKLEDEVWAIFKKIKDKNFSYVDASILAVMQKERINYLLSFDEYFKKLEQEYNFKLIGV